MRAVTTIDVPGLKKHSQGKVRDIFDLGDSLLLVASDRISAFDVVLPTGIPAKGNVLTQISAFWFDMMGMPHHMQTVGWEEVSRIIQEAGGEPKEELAGRSMVVKKAEPVPLECVVRGYISGSLWKEYKAAGGPAEDVTLHGYRFPAGLLESQQLPKPIFTPATKAVSGHDENIDLNRAAEIVGQDLVNELQRRSLDIYILGSQYAQTRGLILADTKFEFGVAGGELLLIDEVLTPDSSRYWDARTYKPGGAEPSYDKQFVRDYLETLNWNKMAPGPELPEDVVRGTSERYIDAFRTVTGRELLLHA